MLRSVISRTCAVARCTVNRHIQKSTPVVARLVHTGPPAIPSDEFEMNLVTILDNPETTGWDVRSIVQEIQGMDMVPDPAVVNSLMKACRRNNDYALAVRILESVYWKCGTLVNTIWPYMMQEIKPTLDDLGILTPDQMGYDKPELYLEDVFDMHK